MRSLSVVVLTLLLSPSSHGQELDNFEQRMYDIYKSSYSHEISDEEWQSYVENVNQRMYQVNKGDTLWGLSKVFFGDGFFWPKIWSYNQKLTNPHLLRVGQNIQFFAGSVEQPPEVVVEPDAKSLTDTQASEARPDTIPKGFKAVEMEVGEEDEETDGSVETDGESGVDDNLVAGGPSQPEKLSAAEQRALRSRLYPGAPKIPAPRQKTRPVLEVLPSSFEEAVSYDASQFNNVGMSFDLRPPVRVNPLYITPNFLYRGRSRNYPWIGLVLESEDQHDVSGLNDAVYIRSKEDLKIGDVFTVMGQKYRFDRNGYAGDVIEYQGKVRIDHVVNAEERIYQGTIVHSIAAVGGQPFISREPIPSFEDDFAGRPTETKLQVIGGGLDNYSRIFGQSDVIYLGGGSDQGIRVGDILGIYKRRDIRYRDTHVARSPMPIGHIKVFRSEPTVASAFVINSTEVIVPGDETGAPTMVEPIATESERKDLNAIESGLDFSVAPQEKPVESFGDESDSLEEELSTFE